jgi:hypothetical protein
MEDSALIASERRFQLWSYTVSHGQLLLRSVKYAGYETRIDVLFKDVGFISLPAAFWGLRIYRTNLDMLRRVADMRFQYSDTAFRITTNDGNGYIAAASVAFHEDRGEYDEPSALL